MDEFQRRSWKITVIFVAFECIWLYACAAICVPLVIVCMTLHGWRSESLHLVPSFSKDINAIVPYQLRHSSTIQNRHRYS